MSTASEEKKPEVSTLERYQLAAKTWHFASEVRLKLMAYWWAVYAGLAVVCGWMFHDPTFRKLAFIVPLFAVFVTWLFWWLDNRNGGAIRGSREILREIEKAINVPPEQRIYERTSYGRTHADAILIFAWVSGLLLIAAAGYLYWWTWCQCAQIAV